MTLPVLWGCVSGINVYTIKAVIHFFLKPCKQIYKTRSEHIRHGVYQYHRQEIFDSIGIEVIVQKSEYHTDNNSGGHTLIGVEGNTNNRGIKQGLPFVLLVYGAQ